jgi:hypothetical protein
LQKFLMAQHIGTLYRSKQFGKKITCVNSDGLFMMIA